MGRQSNKWVPEEDALLREYYDPKNLGIVCSKIPNRSRKGIQYRASLLGISGKYIGFSPERKQKVLELYQMRFNDFQVAKELNISKCTAYRYRNALGLPLISKNTRVSEAKKYAEKEGLHQVDSPTELWVLRFVKVRPVSIHRLLVDLGLSAKSINWIKEVCRGLVKKGILKKEDNYYHCLNYEFEDFVDYPMEFDLSLIKERY